MNDTKPTLRLVSDPVQDTLKLLEDLPNEALAGYLLVVIQAAMRRDLLSTEEQLRLLGLVNSVLAGRADRVA